jgi:hypothetical protein
VESGQQLTAGGQDQCCNVSRQGSEASFNERLVWWGRKAHVAFAWQQQINPKGGALDLGISATFVTSHALSCHAGAGGAMCMAVRQKSTSKSCWYTTTMLHLCQDFTLGKVAVNLHAIVSFKTFAPTQGGCFIFR